MTSEQEFLAVHDVGEDKSGIEIIVSFVFFRIGEVHSDGPYRRLSRIHRSRIYNLSKVVRDEAGEKV